nr:PAS domain-containing protein [Frankia canadensis]
MFDTTAWKMFWRIVENCPVAIFATDAVGRHLFVNQPWSELTGLPRDEAVGHGLEQIVHPDDLATVSDHWRRLITHGDGFSLRIRLIAPGRPAPPAIMQAVETSAGDGRRRIVGTLTPASPPVPEGDRLAGDLLDTDLLGDDRLGDDPLEHDVLGRIAFTEDAFTEDAFTEDAFSEDAFSQDLFRPDIFRPDMFGSELFGQEILGRDALGPQAPGPQAPGPWAGRADGILPSGPDRYGIFDGLSGHDPFDEAAQALGASGAADDDDQPDHQVDGPRQTGDRPAHRRHPSGSGRVPPPGSAHPSGTGRRDTTREPPSGPPARSPDQGGSSAGEPRWTVPRPRRPVPGEPTPGRAGGANAAEERAPSYPRGALPPGAEWRAAVVLHRNEEADVRPTVPTELLRPHDDGDCGCMLAEMRRIEEACRDRERWLTTLLAELTTAVLIADRDGAVVAVNQLYCDLFDLAESPVDLVGTDCRRHLRPRAGLVDDPSGFAARLDTLLRRRRTLRREAVMFADGRVLERSHIALTSADGYRGHLWLYCDVTDRRILEAEIEGLISGL